VHEAHVVAHAAVGRPGGARGLEEGEGPVDVRAQEGGGPVDAAVDVAFRGEVQDGVGGVRPEGVRDGGGVGHVGVHEGVAGVVQDALEGGEVAGVRQGVEGDDAVVGGGEQVADDGGPDEARTAGHEDGAAHERFRPSSFAEGSALVNGSASP